MGNERNGRRRRTGRLVWFAFLSALILAEAVGAHATAFGQVEPPAAGGLQWAAPSSSCGYTRYDSFAPGYNGIQLDTTVLVPVATGNCPRPLLGWPLIVSIHDLGADKTQLAAQAIANAQSGYIAVTFSWRGMGKSTGTFRLLHSDEWQDLASLTNWLTGTYSVTATVVDPTRLGIEGQALGGSAALIAMTQNMGYRDAVPFNTSPYPEDSFTANGCVNNGTLHLFFTANVRWDMTTLNQLWSYYVNQDSTSDLRNFFLAPDHNFSQRLPQATGYLFGFDSWTDEFQFAPQLIRGYFADGTSPKRIYLGTNGHEQFFKFSEVATLEDNLRVAWHARWLQNFVNGIENGGPISYFSFLPGDPMAPTNHITQTDTASWPPPGVISSTLYLRQGSRLALLPPEANEGFETITNTLLDPTYTITNAVYDENPHFSLTYTKLPTSTVVYTSPVLAQPVWWLGAPTVSLFTQADGPNYNVHALFYDVQLDSQGREVSANLLSRAQNCWHAGDPPNLTYQGVDFARRIDVGHVVRVVFENEEPETSFPFYEALRTRPYLANYVVNIFHQAGQASDLTMPLRPDDPGQPIWVTGVTTPQRVWLPLITNNKSP